MGSIGKKESVLGYFGPPSVRFRVTVLFPFENSNELAAHAGSQLTGARTRTIFDVLRYHDELSSPVEGRYPWKWIANNLFQMVLSCALWCLYRNKRLGGALQETYHEEQTWKHLSSVLGGRWLKIRTWISKGRSSHPAAACLSFPLAHILCFFLFWGIRVAYYKFIFECCVLCAYAIWNCTANTLLSIASR